MRNLIRAGLYCFIASSLFFGCSKTHDPVSLNPNAQHNTNRHLLDPRTNPLQDYIQTNWSASAVGGMHYENIKIYGHSYAEVGATDATFIANHFDMYMGGGTAVRDAVANSALLLLGEAANIPHVRGDNGVTAWDSLQAVAFLSTANPNNYQFDDLLLHYSVNTSTWAVIHTTPGWNPADDNDGDGTIEAGEGLNHNGLPSDPNRSAQHIWDARVRNAYYDPNNVKKHWLMANPGSQAYIDFRAWYANYDWNNNLGEEGFHFDEASYQNPNLHFENLLEYPGQDPNDPSFTYIADKYEFVPAVMSQVEDLTGNGPTVAIANMVSGDYLCWDTSYLAPQHDYAYDNLENIFLEDWMINRSAAYMENRGRMLDCPLTDFLEHGKGVVFTYREDSTPGRLFSLCMYYMINHQMSFYYYTKQGHSGVNASTGQWNQWVSYNVGQPMVNDLGRNDFQGNSGTDKFFVFASDTNYQVLGREYYRDSDGAIILVLAKLMAYGQTAGGSSTPNVSLGANYKILSSTFTLSGNVSSVALNYNEGVILVRSGTGSGGCHCLPYGE